jgi:microcystin-dependent protein
MYLMTKEDMRAELLKLIQEGIDLNPIGTIISFIGQQPPATYLRCDGGQYVIADYQELADFIVVNFGAVNYFGGDGERYFAVPDMRGEFLRGTGVNGHENQGNGADVGVHQDGTEHIVLHADPVSEYVFVNTNIYRPLNNADCSNSYSTTRLMCKFSKETTSQIYAVGTSRPTNTSVLFCIKAKNG